MNIKNNFKAIIFDLDGTLLDTISDIAISMNKVLEKKGFATHPISDYRFFVGEGASRLVEKSLPKDKISDKLINNLREDFFKEYDESWNITSKPYKNIPEMLGELSKIHLKKAVLSNKPHNFTIECMKYYFSEYHFDIIRGHIESKPRKPDPTSALEIAEKFSVKPEETLYVGDSSIDMKTANSAGMFAMGVSWGFRTIEELMENGAKKIVDNPLEIIDFL
jgi:phosphoglycolate phosphatase